MKTNYAKAKGVCFGVLLVFMLMFVGAFLCARASNFDIPTPDVTYGVGGDYPDWEGTLEVNENKTVKISGITHDNTETTYGSAIKICGNSTVNLVFEGENALSGNPAQLSDTFSAAGIEVESGSTVNIYGVDGSTLTVTGGRWGAGIGGIGYRDPSREQRVCGNINIYSGNITAIGGYYGAGIGSGYHSSALDINIKGGNITALGPSCGAGIGSGYGTSGGAARDKDGNITGAGVGFYNGGNITISGGIVRAAAYQMNFDNFDPYNLDTLYGEGYSNTFAAGIGGGYGASSGNIIIEGDADVIAIGSCGGAGIGSGRGTSSKNKYDDENFDVNITIRGNAKVIAMATRDARNGYENKAQGGAAIGIGRGCTLKDGEAGGGPKGTVKIEGNANVYAVALNYAQAIGGSRISGDTDTAPIFARLESISIGSNTVVIGISDGQAEESIDCANNPSSTKNFVLLNFNKKDDDDYFARRSDFFTDDKFPLKIEAVDADNIDSKKTFAIQAPEQLCVMSNIIDAKRYNFIIKDYQGENGEKIFISNGLEDNSAQFFSDSTAVKKYNAENLTARLDRDGSMDSDYGNLKLKIEAREGIFEYGSTFFCDRIEDPYVIDELNSKLDKEYSDKLERILYFDIGVRDRNGVKYTEFKGEKIKIYVEVPNGWDKDEVLALFVRSLDDETFTDTQKLEVIDGITYLSFEIDHFSNYALFDPKEEENEHHENNEHNKSEPEEEEGGEINNEINNEKSSENDFLSTGDKILVLCTALILIMIVSLGSMTFLFREPGKRFKK